MSNMQQILDAGPDEALSFLRQQAAHIETDVYRIDYPQYKSKLVLDIDNSAPEFAKTVLFNSIDAAGHLKFSGDMITDVPTVDIAASQGAHFIQNATLGYNYSISEIGFAMLNGTNLDTERAMAVRDVVEQDMNQLYLLGNTSVGSKGLYNSELVSKGTASKTIATLISENDPQGVVTIFANAYNAVYITNTNTVHMPTNFTMPPATLRLLSNTIINSANASNISYLTLLKQTFPEMTFTDDLNLVGIGATSTDRLVTHKKNIRCVKGHEPMGLRFFAPATADNINFKVPAMIRTGGTEFRIPKSAHYTDGI